ncbi:MAG: DEAD/DEAH box helicase, partial [Blastocatellia bacterium]
DKGSPDTFLLRKGVHPFDFLTRHLPRLVEAGFEVYGESALTSRVNRAKPTISFNVTSGIDWFDLKATITWGDQQVPLENLRRALRRDERFIKLADGSIGEIPSDWLDKYRHLFGLSEARDDGYRVSRHHVALLDDLFASSEKVKVDRKFEAAREWLRNFNGITAHDAPTRFCGELRPYQKAGFDWLHFLRQAGFGGCLADDMGTGKTIQTLSFLLSLKEENEQLNRRRRKKEPAPVHLLVVPRSLVVNWIREAERFTPDLRILDFAHGLRTSDLLEFNKHDIVITTYGILIREIDRLRDYEFDTAILDEAQAIKNPASESARAARAINCRHRLTLTGTPVENNTFELWSQFAFLNPGLLGSADYFREHFIGPIERQNDEPTARTLKRLIHPFILRRTKDQVVSDLPPRSEKILWGEMEPDQRQVYDETRNHYRDLLAKLIEEKGIRQARFRILEGLLRLRQICNHPKLVSSGYRGGSAKMDALLETLETARAEGHKILVFSQFVKMLKLIETELVRRQTPFAYLDGSTTNRQERVDQFQQDDGVGIFLISLKAGGVGLNLTAADYVVHVDPWWNPAVEMQASDRAHRIGQDKPVFIYKLMIKDSVEEKILQLQEKKRSLVTQLISTEAGFFKSLSSEDVELLFT